VLVKVAMTENKKPHTLLGKAAFHVMLMGQLQPCAAIGSLYRDGQQDMLRD